MYILFLFCNSESSTVREQCCMHTKRKGQGERGGRERKREREGGRAVLCTYGDVLLSVAVPIDDLQQTLHHSTGHQGFYTYNDSILQCDSHSTSTRVLHQHTKASNTRHIVYSIKKMTVLIVHQTKQYIAKERYIILIVLITHRILQANKKDRYKTLKKDTGY